MKIVLTNDDGIDAPGIKALGEAISGEKIWIAPQKEYSQCGHQVTTHQGIHVEKRSEIEYAIGGTPADCIRLAVSHLCPDLSWVISGINPGGNMGVDVYISGTVAAVREAAIQGIPGISLSQYRKGGKPVNWQRATRWANLVLNELMKHPPQRGCFWNVNFPYLEPEDPEPDMVFCKLGTQSLPINYRIEGDYFHYHGNYSDRLYEPGTDVEVCFRGKIAVSLIKL
ncbi:MAG: 5'/3'-nucleotidase SurE [Planktothrix sp.]